VDSLVVLPGYFQTVRTPILEGRAFTEADNAPDQNVVVVDEFLARRAFGAERPIDKRILIRVRTPEPEWVRIVGVARHIRGNSLAEPGREQVYFTDGFVGRGLAFRWCYALLATRFPSPLPRVRPSPLSTGNSC